MATPMATPVVGMQGGGGGAGMLGVQRLPPEVNRILYVRNLPFNMSPEELYKIFGDYGAIRQIRMYANSPAAHQVQECLNATADMSCACRGCEKKTKGTAYVVYEDIFDAKRAQEGLSGFNVQNRYLIVLYWNQKRQQLHLSMKDDEAKLRRVQEQHGVDGEQHAPPKRQQH